MFPGVEGAARLAGCIRTLLQCLYLNLMTLQIVLCHSQQHLAATVQRKRHKVKGNSDPLDAAAVILQQCLLAPAPSEAALYQSEAGESAFCSTHLLRIVAHTSTCCKYSACAESTAVVVA